MDEQTFWETQAPPQPTTGLPPTTLALTVPSEIATLPGNSSQYLELAEAFVVDNEPAFQTADEMQSRFKTEAKQINDKRMSFTKPLDDLKAQWMSFFKPAVDARTSAASILQRKMSAFRQVQREKAEAAQREAERLLREEREKKEAEARRLEEKAAKLKTTVAQTKAMQQADEIRQVAAMMPESVAIAASAPQAVASNIAEIWDVEKVEDVSAYLRWLADHPEWHCVLAFKTAEHKRMAKQFHAIGVPGMKFGKQDSYRNKTR